MNETENTSAAEGVAEEIKVTKTKKKAMPKKSAKGKAPKQQKVTKPKKERTPKGPKADRTFAIRITGAELEAIHKAAGPRNATRLIRAVAAAFAAEDEAAFRAVVKEAREARG